MIDTDILMVEIQRIKNQLQQEISLQRYADTSAGKPRKSHNDTTLLTSLNNTGLQQTDTYPPTTTSQAQRVDSTGAQNRQKSPSQNRQSELPPGAFTGGSQSNSGSYQVAQDGAAKSTMRLQLGNLKRKVKDLEGQVNEKD